MIDREDRRGTTSCGARWHEPDLAHALDVVGAPASTATR